MFGFGRRHLGLYVGQETEPSMDTWPWVPRKTVEILILKA